MKITHELDDVREFYSIMVGVQHVEVHIQGGNILQVIPGYEKTPELITYIEDNIILKEGTAILDCRKRTIKFKFQGRVHIVDLTMGDLEDSWFSIETPEGNFDTNFSWEEEDEKPAFALYKVEDGCVNLGTEITIEIIKQIGTVRNYFDYTPKGMRSRDEVIQLLVNKEIDKIKEDINTDVSVLSEYLENGFRGYTQFTNEQLVKEYFEVFNEIVHIKYKS